MTRRLGGHPIDPAAVLIEDEPPVPRSKLSPSTVAAEADTRPLAPTSPAPATPRRWAPARWFWLSLALFVGGAVVVQAVDFVDRMFARDTALGALFTGLLAATIVSALYWAVMEIRQLRRLRAVEPLREESLRLIQSEDYDGASPWIDRVAGSLGVDKARNDLIERARDKILDTHTDASAMCIFHDTVLVPLDERAYAAIARAARGAALGVSVSPLAVLDAALVLWRSVKMVREIAEAYGLRPGFAGSILLLRHLLLSGIYVASVDILGNVWVEHVGERTTSFLSARLAEGVVAAVRVARLGLLTMEACRPMAFQDQDRPSLMKLRKQIMTWRE